MPSKTFIIILVLLAMFSYLSGVFTLYYLAGVAITFSVAICMLSLPAICMLAFIIYVIINPIE